MRVLLASSSSGSRGGGEIYLLYLGRALAARGHEVVLWASTHRRMDELCASFAAVGRVERDDYRNTYDYRTRSVAAALNFRASRRIAKRWAQLAPDVVHLNKQNLEDGLDLLRAAKQSGLPHLSTVHLTQSAKYLRAQLAWLRDLCARHCLRRDRGPLVCVLEERAQDLARFLGDGARARVVPNGVELYDLSDRAAARETQRSALGIAPDELLLAAVGRLVPQKRPFVFLDLAQRIHAQLPQARFVWVGDGNLAEPWDAEVKKRNLSHVVRRIGWQSRVRDFLFAADAFLHTAEFEGLPLAILEALSAGLPCAITPNLLAEMPFLNASNSIAIGNDDAWASVLGDRAKLAELGRNARALAEEQFSFDLMAQRYEALYREAIAARRQP
jgi:glycosyltransferase involved in cell wall biosynthesis